MPFKYLTPGEKALFKDQFVTKISECVHPYKEGATGDIGIIGLPFSKTSISVSQASEAPQTIRQCLQGCTTYAHDLKTDFRNRKLIDFGDVHIHPTNTDETLNRLHESVKEMLSTKSCERYIMLGGDHGVSFPSINAFAEQFGTVGVIQWDAHHDVRNLEDGGRTNGTPFRSLLEEGVIEGEHLVQVGIRDFSNAKAYAEYAEEKGIHVYTMGDVDQQGLLPILKSEIERLSVLVDYIYLSVDMDVVDQAFAPGCPAIGPGGLTSRELLNSITFASQYEKVKAMDIVEIDPSKDFRDMTSRLAAHVMMRFLSVGK